MHVWKYFFCSTWEFYHGSSVHTMHKQTGVLTGIQALESATHMANQLSLFSTNEEVDEITTTNLKWGGEPVTFDSTFGVNRCHCLALRVFVLLCCQVRPVTEWQWLIVENNERIMCDPCAADESRSPDPTAPSYEEKGLVTTECVQGCAEWTVSINKSVIISLWCNAISLTNNSLHM